MSATSGEIKVPNLGPPHQPQWLRAALDAQGDHGVRAAFSTLFDEVQDQLQSEDHAALADMLSRLADAADKLDPVLPTAGLRLTWTARSSIASWSSARDTIARALQAAGHDPQSVLIGLYDD
jgi:hypothetical protein